MKEKFQRFMIGRYGMDELSKVYMVVTVILLVLSMITRLNVFYVFGLLLLIYSYYRMFSRNIQKMYQQNQKYLQIKNKLFGKWNNFRKHFAQRKEYHFYKCPQCKQKIRVPKGKGKISITCPKCRHEFIKKS